MTSEVIDALTRAWKRTGQRGPHGAAGTRSGIRASGHSGKERGLS